MLSQQIRKHYYYETFGINKQPKVFYVPANKNHTHKFCLSLILEKNLETHNLINSWELCYFADRKKEDIGVKYMYKSYLMVENMLLMLVCIIEYQQFVSFDHLNRNS